jgi:hypothetical protein
MVWLRSEQSLMGHPKTKRAARTLGLSIPAMIGHLHCLWYWALDYAQDGSLSKYESWEIADAALYPGDPDDFIQALKECGNDRPGFLEVTDQGLTIHDWWDYAGCLIEARKANADRMKAKRAAHVQDTCKTRTGATVTNKELQTNKEEEREPRKNRAATTADFNGNAKHVAAWVDACVEAGLGEPTKSDKAVFGAKVKSIVNLDDQIMHDTILRMVELGKPPPMAALVYGDVKRMGDDEIARMRTEVRRVR